MPSFHSMFYSTLGAVSRVSMTSALLCLISSATAQDKPRTWPPAEGIPITPWGKGITMDSKVWQEYPRPQLVRERWLNLNGPWDYAIAPKEEAQPKAYEGRILVPFAVESVLSQVARTVGAENKLHYRRKFQVPEEWNGQRVLLHFGAVDWSATVWVNGKEVGSHQGGYDPFSFDITGALKPGAEQELRVSVWDPTRGGQPHGKQTVKPGGIFYTPSSGIWQTVWLEPVPVDHLDKLVIEPDLDHSQVKLSASTSDGFSGNLTLEAVVLDGGKEIARAEGPLNRSLAVAVPNAKLWWPESPFLYDLKVTLKRDGKAADTVGSYFGMRKISLGDGPDGRKQIWLNNAFVFQNGLLDQGYWPDGLYTAPSDEALRYDIEMTRKLGFNLLRKHIKVEPARWYYWADRLGMLVWQDMPSSRELGENKRKPGLIDDPEGQYELELRRMVQGLYNHPSIVMWVIFNEGWGLVNEAKFDYNENVKPIVKQRIERMTRAVRQEDPTRLIDSESGTGGSDKREGIFDFGFGDTIDYHTYCGQIPRADKDRAAVVGEYGWGPKVELRVPGFLKESKGYGLSGIVLTQLTGVENEDANGRLGYDRSFQKIGNTPLEEIAPKLIDELHKAGYENYPGHAPAAR